MGYTYITSVRDGMLSLVTGSLIEGEEHTSPVVLAARERASSLSSDLLVVDTSAGTGNSVSIALEKSNIVIAVTEPTPLGLHDLRMILDLTSEMGLETWVVVNRSNIGPEEKVVETVSEYGAEIVAKIPYSREVLTSYVKGEPLVKLFPESSISGIFSGLAKRIQEVL